MASKQLKLWPKVCDGQEKRYCSGQRNTKIINITLLLSVKIAIKQTGRTKISGRWKCDDFQAKFQFSSHLILVSFTDTIQTCQ